MSHLRSGAEGRFENSRRFACLQPVFDKWRGAALVVRDLCSSLRQIVAETDCMLFPFLEVCRLPERLGIGRKHRPPAQMSRRGTFYYATTKVRSNAKQETETELFPEKYSLSHLRSGAEGRF